MAFQKIDIPPKGAKAFRESGLLTHPKPGTLIAFRLRLVGGGGGGAGWSTSGTPSITNGGTGGNTTVSNGSETVVAIGGAGGNCSSQASWSRAETAIPLRSLGLSNIHHFGTLYGQNHPALIGYGGQPCDNSNTPDTPAMHGENGQYLEAIIESDTDLTINVGAGGAGGFGNYSNEKGKPGTAGYVEIIW